MNRTVQISRIKLTIFFVTSLFAMTLLIQSTAHGQITPIVRTPRTVPVAMPTPTTTTIVKPGSPIIITGKPNIHPDISNNLLPDLQIADITYNPTECLVKIRVVNTGGPMDFLGNSNFDVIRLWVNMVGVKPSMWTYKMWPNVDDYYKLPANQEIVRELSLVVGGGEVIPGGGYIANSVSKGNCYINDVTEVRAVVDPRFLQAWEPEVKRTIYGDLIKPGTAVPAGWNVVEPVIKEKDENNNELIVKRADMKLY